MIAIGCPLSTSGHITRRTDGTSAGDVDCSWPGFPVVLDCSRLDDSLRRATKVMAAFSKALAELAEAKGQAERLEDYRRESYAKLTRLGWRRPKRGGKNYGARLRQRLPRPVARSRLRANVRDDRE